MRKIFACFGVAIACVLASGTAAVSPASGSTQGSSVTWAEFPSVRPTYIFPFVPLAEDTPANVPEFQYLMYRPLYYFGTAGRPKIDLRRSLAVAPVVSDGGRSLTVVLKPYRWSDGERVSAKNVLFWMNLLHAERQNWGGYAPGTIPDNLASVTTADTSRVTLTFVRPYDLTWLLYNELSEITPLPTAWDVSARGARPGSGGCSHAPYGTADSACRAVWAFLSRQSGYDPAHPGAATPVSSFARNPLWGVVDGPWRLAHIDDAGNVTMTANRDYSGPVKPRYTTFRELPFDSGSAELDALITGAVDVGYLPDQYAPHASNPLVARGNYARLTGYRMSPFTGWGFAYLPYNFNSTGDGGVAGAILRQLYVRQALQEMVDQPLYVDKIFNGYATTETGPIPRLPLNTFAPGPQVDPYPYSPARARRTLLEHGWSVASTRTTTCVRPGTAAGECGAGIPAHTPLQFTLLYGTGDTAEADLLTAEQSSWRQAGIEISLRALSPIDLAGEVGACAGGPACGWELAATGWLYSPDIYPTGEELFSTGALGNVGSYSDPVNNANIASSYQGDEDLDTYQRYLRVQLPVVWQPQPVTTLTEVKDTVDGVLPQNAVGTLDPEDWAPAVRSTR